MERQLARLDSSELDAVAVIGDDGALQLDTDALAKLISKAVGAVGIRVAVSSADYLQHGDGTVEPATRTFSGIWWLSNGDDTALIGGFIVEGLAMTITPEGEGEAPLTESAEIVDRATRAIASQYEGSEIVETGLARLTGPAGEKLARVVVTRDYRIRRPQDILNAAELLEFNDGHLGLAIVQVVGGNKALVVKHGV